MRFSAISALSLLPGRGEPCAAAARFCLVARQKRSDRNVSDGTVIGRVKSRIAPSCLLMRRIVKVKGLGIGLCAAWRKHRTCSDKSKPAPVARELSGFPH